MTHNPRLKDKYGLVTSLVMRDPNVSVAARGLYAYLATYADVKTSETNVGISRMANEMGVTESTIKRCIKTLLDNGIITRVKRANSKTLVTVLLK